MSREVVVELPMGLHARERLAGRHGQGLEGNDLRHHRVSHADGVEPHRSSTEPFAVEIGGMSTYAHAIADTGVNGGGHRGLVTGVTTTGDVGGGQQLDQRLVMDVTL